MTTSVSTPSTTAAAAATTNDQIVTAFCASWTAGNVDAIIEAFTDNAVYHNIPMAPLVGKEAIGQFIRSFLTADASIAFETRHQLSHGNVVMNERVDIVTTHGKTVRLPVMGVFELADGKITAWRDYFDMGMFSGA
jgi:limonene-1,2-epoxide hydrolase